ncbi:sulfurtransferase complex subunit TusB [Thermopetrobacter sp. TC1]|uniref:sulfurtransferase complex subunit TusB n=1 Tax=Thermopetrobacter sp. TC1 TaxID=1495045 RepID=UPI000571A281|nr:sulfurtransferase complex subunit TusB [Thermopetrobacter sp. TC1]
MALLHTVNKSPYERNTLESCLNHVQEGDTVLLIEDGVYAVIKGGRAADVLASVKGVKIAALSADLKARGITADKMIDGVEVVDYGGFVDLVTSNDKVQAWL